MTVKSDRHLAVNYSTGPNFLAWQPIDTLHSKHGVVWLSNGSAIDIGRLEGSDINSELGVGDYTAWQPMLIARGQ